MYSFFDLLRDVGGAAFFLSALFSAANSIFTLNKLENQLVAQLYKKPVKFWETKEEIKGSD